MFRGIAIAVVSAVLACTSSSWAEEKETSTPDEFRQLGDLFVGRWSADIKFVANWPGQDLGKGERITGFAEYSWVVDKKAIRNNGIVGNVSHSDTFVWDPASKHIKLFAINSSGDTGEVILWKKSDRVFSWRIIGGGVVDGRPHSGTGELVFSEDGRTMTLQGQTTLGGVKNDPLKDVYKKLSP